MRIVALASVVAGLCATTAPAATLVHAYEFTTHPGYAFDSVGSSSGTFYGGATASGGYLTLDGDDDYVQFSDKLVPLTDPDFGLPAFSLFIRYLTTGVQTNYATELVSQGYSGGPGFYLGEVQDGNVPHNIRVSDNYGGGVGFTLPVGYHDLLLTSGGGNGTNLLVDGTSVFSVDGDLNLVDYGGGTPTRFGKQFYPYAENFAGKLDSVRFFSGIADYSQASAGLRALDNPGTVPEPASWALMLGGFGLIGATLRRGRKTILA